MPKTQIRDGISYQHPNCSEVRIHEEYHGIIIFGSSCNILQHLVGLTSPQADYLLLFSVEWSPLILYSAIEGIELLLHFYCFTVLHDLLRLPF